MANSMAPPLGGKSPGITEGQKHGQASEMAFAASKRARVARVLGSKAGASPVQPVQPVQPMGYRDGLGDHGDIHSAIDALTQAGHFTAHQGDALKAHHGPLEGPAGDATAAKIKTQMAVMKSQGRKAQAPV